MCGNDGEFDGFASQTSVEGKSIYNIIIHIFKATNTSNLNVVIKCQSGSFQNTFLAATPFFIGCYKRSVVAINESCIYFSSWEVQFEMQK
jgi:hypothetical protein